MTTEQLQHCKEYLHTIVEEYIYNYQNLISEVNECDEDSDKYKKAKAALPIWKKGIETKVQDCKEDFGEDNDLPREEFYPIYCLFNALIAHPEDDNIADDIQDCLDILIKKYTK